MPALKSSSVILDSGFCFPLSAFRFPRSAFHWPTHLVAEHRATLYDGTKFVKPLTSYTCKLTDAQAAALAAHLRDGGFKPREVPYARFAGEKDKLNVVFYESGKLVVQGKGTQEFVEFVLEPEILQEAKLGYEAVLNPELLLPRLGVDESGKGDFFGPLCIAGVYVNESVLNAWKDAGVRDSKNISSDKKIAELAKLIRGTPGCVNSVVPVGNEAYNRLYTQFRSVNKLLAWGHARVIENLMGLRYQMNPPPVRAISDQFAHDKNTVAKALMNLGREIELVQRHKAEEDMAVAAAANLARQEVLTRRAGLVKQFGVKLAKGAASAVDAAAKEFLAQHGVENLPKVAKMHFRTALRAQGLPEPPKVEWRRRGPAR
ncbi:MAG: ribonuclease HIII [Verrucomicrobia bacterium]|nr:ribonuclease HIII [Verrucomicrobiota bacterium]